MTKTCPCCRHGCFRLAASCEACGWDFLEDNLPPLRDDRLRSPYPFFGTKKRIVSDLWRLFGKVNRYVEPFLGSAAMLLARPKDRKVHCVVNEKNRYLSNFWRAVQFQPDEVVKWCDWPVNEADLHARHSWLEAQPFEEAIAGTPSGEDILERIRKLEDGLQQDPLWCDPKIAGWWAWGQSSWIGGRWCAGQQEHRGEKAVRKKGRQRDGTEEDGILSNRRPETHNLKGVNVHRGKKLSRYFRLLQAELRDVIVCCGDWTRAVTRYVLGEEGKPCAIFLDPPYRRYGLCYGRYHDDLVSARVRAWAVENGQNERLRIALCGFDGEHEMPRDWSIYRWNHDLGMSKGGKNVGRERVWCSPSIKPLERLDALVRVE